MQRSTRFIAGLVAALAAMHTAASAEVVVGLLNENNLTFFRTEDVTNPSRPLPVTGLVANDTLLAIDVRPATGGLYAIGTERQLYRIDAGTGVATAVGSPVAFEAVGERVTGFDFNPTVDRIRVFTSGNGNYRMNPDTGAIAATDTDPTYAAGDLLEGTEPTLDAAAYTNSVAGATTTVLYAIDRATGMLVRLASPNGGVCSSVGLLNGNVMLQSGMSFDISPSSNGAFATVPAGPGSAFLHKVDLRNGAATLLGTVPAPLNGIAVMPAQREELLYSVTSGGQLVSFYSSTPGVLNSAVDLTGLPGAVRGIDFRPATGELFAFCEAGALVTIDPATGAATTVGNTGLTINTQLIGFDFNPTVDRIRLVHGDRGNFRLNPDTAALAATDTNLAYDAADANASAFPSVAAAAYTANTVGGGPTTLYGIDVGTDALVRQGSEGGSPVSPNAGTLFTVAPLGADLSGDVAMDVSGSGGVAYLLAGRPDLPGAVGTVLHRVDLATGAVTVVGETPRFGSATLGGIAVSGAPTGNPAVALTTLTGVQWENFAVPSVYTAPTFGDAGQGLEFTVASNPSGTFGGWQTRRELAALPEGSYRVRVEFEPIGETDGARLPEIRVRLFNADNTFSRFVVVADTIPANAAPRSIDLLWDSDGTTPWRVAFDLLSFLPDIQGGWRIKAITPTRLP